MYTLIDRYYLQVFAGQDNGLENPSGMSTIIRVGLELIWIDVVIVRMFFVVEVVTVGDFLLHLRVQIRSHLLLYVLLIVGSHLFIDNLGFLHTLQEGHQLSFRTLDLLLVLVKQLLTLLGIFWEELVFVTEGMVENEL